MDLTLLFDPHPQEEEKDPHSQEEETEEEVRPQQLGGKLEEPQESYKKSKKKKNNNKKKNKQQENGMKEEDNNNNIQKNKEEEEEKKKNDANIIKYRPPPKDGLWNIQVGEKYEFIRLLFSKLRDYLIKYSGHQVRPQQLCDKLEEPHEESHKKSKKNKNKQLEDNNIQKNKEQKEEGKNNANIFKYRPPPQDDPWNIQEGKKYDVIPLLFSKLRGYLIKYDGHQGIFGTL